MSRFTLSRRAFLAASASAAGTAIGAGYYTTLVEPFWLDVHTETHNLTSWPTGLDNLRIAHLTDLHLDARTPRDYLRELSRRVREEIKPDLVAYTGDLTTHDADHLAEGADWLASFNLPTFVCLGNHDYDPATSVRPFRPMSLAEDLERLLRNTPVRVLRNSAVPLNLTPNPSAATTAPSTSPSPAPPTELWIAGVEDFYTGLCDGNAAVASVPPGSPRLMLCHNPDAWRLVDDAADGGLVLSGHTHGGQIRLPFFGPILVPVQERDKVAGLVQLSRSKMYVSRGVGYLLRARFNCRPELAVHRILVRPTISPT